MASIHLARLAGPAGFERPVAVKVINDHLVEDPQFIQMFLSEAKIAATLSHPNIAQIYDLGEDDGTYFIAMEYLAGHNLAEIIRRVRKEVPGVLDIRSGCHIVMEACEGLHHAHDTTDMEGNRLELVHRDISPQNIFVTYDGTVKLMDFGIARAVGIATATKPGSLKGKFSYMSPEQARGTELDRRSDIFAMGVVLWELLTGRRLFKGTSDMDTLSRVSKAQVPPLSSIRNDAPLSLDAVLARALSQKREHRFESGAELYDALSVVAHEIGPPVKARQLSKYISRWFAEEKAAKRELLAEASRIAASGEPPLLDSDEGSGKSVEFAWKVPKVDGESSSSVDTLASLPSVTNDDLSQSESMDIEPARRKGPIVALLAVITLLLVGGALGYVYGGFGDTADSTSDGSNRTTESSNVAPVPRNLPVPISPTPITTDAEPAASKTVTLTLSATPAAARFKLDGEPLEGNPYTSAFEASSEDHQLVVEAEGHDSVERTLRFDESLRLELTLTPTKTSSKAPRSKGRPGTVRRPRKASGSGATGTGISKQPAKRPSKNQIYTVPPWER